MSNKAMAYVWETDLNGSIKLMLLAIADRCDEFGMCFPGVEHLAKKCGIQKRAAQKLISKLEELGELVVIVSAGTKTNSGKTNRYFMKKFRDSLDITTPEIQARGVQTDIPQDKQGVSKRTSHGVSKRTSHGVSKRTPNPTDNPTDNPNKATPIEPSSNSQKLEQPSEQKIPKPQEVLGTVMEKPPVTNSDWALYGKVCKELKQAGIEPSGYSDYVKWVKRLAQTSGGWKVSIPSLISGGRVSDYVATKNKLSKPAAPREKTIQEIGEEYIANTLKAISKKASA